MTINGAPLDAPTHARDFYEWEALTIALLPPPNVGEARLTIGGVDLGEPLLRLGDPWWRWQWRAPQAVGRYEAALCLRDAGGGDHIERFELRILPAKIDLERYESLIAAMQRDMHAIIYALSGGREAAALRRELSPDRSLIEEYVALVERHAQEAVGIALSIAARPHESLAATHAEVSLAEAERIEPQALCAVTRVPLEQVDEDVLPQLQRALRPPGVNRGGPLPRSIAVNRSRATYDTIEHRLLKHVLATILWRSGVVRELARRESLRRQRAAALSDSSAAVAIVEAWIERCGATQARLRRALALPFFESIGAPAGVPRLTHLLRRDPRYRRLWRLAQDLRSTPFIAFDSPALWPALYEQWCALQVVRAVLPLGEVVEQRLIESDDDGVERRWTLRLRPHAPLLRLRRADGVELAVRYQRRYEPHSAEVLGAIDPFVRIPDIAIEVTHGARARVLIFDAKYRVDDHGRVPQDALDDAYAYRSAIGVGGERATLGAFLLFPGTQPVALADEVGALPLLPGATAALDALIARLTHNAP